jgi:hypothetical protein
VRFSGTPADPNDVFGFNASDLEWFEAVITLGGVAVDGESWTLSVNTAATGTKSKTFSVNADNRALSKIVADWANYFATLAPTGGVTFHAESQVDIAGNAKLRLWRPTAAAPGSPSSSTARSVPTAASQ